MANGYAGKIARLNLSTKEITRIDTDKYEQFGGGFGIGVAFCETVLPAFVNRFNQAFSGPSPDVEIRYYQAVTGKKIGFAETMEIGRKIWNLERAIRVLQGRHRDQEKFFPYVCKPGAAFIAPSGGEPVYKDGKWSWQPLIDMYLDESGVELFKTNFYKLEGWDVSTGWPTKKTLQELSLNKVADTLSTAFRNYGNVCWWAPIPV